MEAQAEQLLETHRCETGKEQADLGDVLDRGFLIFDFWALGSFVRSPYSRVFRLLAYPTPPGIQG
jgi:hypothetical protein